MDDDVFVFAVWLGFYSQYLKPFLYCYRGRCVSARTVDSHCLVRTHYSKYRPEHLHCSIRYPPHCSIKYTPHCSITYPPDCSIRYPPLFNQIHTSLFTILPHTLHCLNHNPTDHRFYLL